MTEDHRFGGDWTTAKLAILERYLVAYATALKGQGFEKLYVDAFAGTGYRLPRPDPSPSAAQGRLFPDLAGPEPQALLDGSARIALRSEPCFDRYLFIERSAVRCEALRLLADEFPGRASRVEIREGEANEEIRGLCRGGWRGRRAVLFLDPYGMQVRWSTIEAVAATRAIDLCSSFLSASA